MKAGRTRQHAIIQQQSEVLDLIDSVIGFDKCNLVFSIVSIIFIVNHLLNI